MKKITITAAAIPIAINGSANPERNGSGGIVPFVNGNESFSRDFKSSTFTVSIRVISNSLFPLSEKV